MKNELPKVFKIFAHADEVDVPKKVILSLQASFERFE